MLTGEPRFKTEAIAVDCSDSKVSQGLSCQWLLMLEAMDYGENQTLTECRSEEKQEAILNRI